MGEKIGLKHGLFAVFTIFAALFLSYSHSFAATELIVDGGFTSNPVSSAWHVTTAFYADQRFNTYNNGPGYAYLSQADGSPGNNLTGWIYQDVTIPANAATASLSFWYRITSDETGSTAKDFLNVQIRTPSDNYLDSVASLSNLNKNTSYAQKIKDVSSYRGSTIRIHFLGSTDNSNPTVFRIDDVSLTYVEDIPAPPSITSPGTSNEQGEIISTLTPTFQWQSVSGADKYGLYISKYPYGEGNVIYENENLTGTSFTIPSSTLENGVQYRWNMRAHNSSGWSVYSSKLYFKPNQLSPAQITIGPASLDFGEVQIGLYSPLTFAIQHVVGTAPASGSISVDSNPPYNLISEANFSLSNGAAKNIEIRFAPTTTGTLNGTCTITSNATQNINSVSLTGVGTPSSATEGIIMVSAKLNGNTWIGAVNYQFSGPVSFSGNTTPGFFENRPIGAYTMTFLSGGPESAVFESITPSATQTLYGASITNFVLNFTQVTSNHNPTLSWTGEPNYTNDGLNPETGDTSSSFHYMVKYTDIDNDPPATDYPKVHILKNGAEISGSPFSMSYVLGNYNAGTIYNCTKTLPIGTEYTYYFEAKDNKDAVATGEPTSSKDAPDVSENSQPPTQPPVIPPTPPETPQPPAEEPPQTPPDTQNDVGEGSPTEAIRQAFIQAYDRNGGLTKVGSPNADNTGLVHQWGNGYIQNFTDANNNKAIIMIKSGATTAYCVWGGILAKYEALQGPSFPLGFPTSDEKTAEPSVITGVITKYNTFEYGSLQYHTTGDYAGETFAVYGQIYERWGKEGAGYVKGPLGNPISDVYTDNGNPKCNFENGYITYTNNRTYAYYVVNPLIENNKIYDGRIEIKWQVAPDIYLESGTYTLEYNKDNENSWHILKSGESGQIYCLWDTRLISYIETEPIEQEEGDPTHDPVIFGDGDYKFRIRMQINDKPIELISLPWEIKVNNGLKGRKPVILIHGVNSDANTWDVPGKSFMKALENTGKYIIWRFQYPTAATSKEQPIVRSAGLLAEALQVLKNAGIGGIDNNTKFSIVAHSMGGLVTRAYTLELPENGSTISIADFGSPVINLIVYGKDVEKLIMLGTPNHGSNPQFFGNPSTKIVFNPDLSSFGPFMISLMGKGINRDVQHAIIWGNIPFKDLGLFDGDGVVSERSAKLNEFDVQSYETIRMHSSWVKKYAPSVWFNDLLTLTEVNLTNIEGDDLFKKVSFLLDIDNIGWAPKGYDNFAQESVSQTTPMMKVPDGTFISNTSIWPPLSKLTISVPNDEHFQATSIESIEIAAQSDKLQGIIPIPKNYLNTVREFKVEDENGNVISKFNGKVTVGIPYSKLILAALDISESSLKLFYLDESTGKWEKIDNAFVDTGKEHVSADVNHFSVYRIMAVDDTPPSVPVVTDDGVETTDNTKLHATWTSADPETGIEEYKYAIGSSPRGTDVVDWTAQDKTVTEINHLGLNLENRNTYYISIKARNQANLWSEIGTSDGIKMDLIQSNFEQTRAFPNPCKSPPLTISCLPKEGEVTIEIYNIVGELIRTLNENEEIQSGAGSKTAVWDCANESERLVANGIYICYIRDERGNKKIIKIAVVR